MKKLKVVELFAGVGGFRIGLDNAGSDKVGFDTVWANQWEPSTKRQHAAEIYETKFGKKGFSCDDIFSVIEKDFESIPDHDLLVGGFPCQDYSVARTLAQSHGLIGRKGVLWWSIYSILKRKGEKAPKYLFLENVDRLLKSPASQRGRDFAIMLSSLNSLEYAVEWRVINAADYGFPQRRRRVFIIGYKKGTKLYNELKKKVEKKQDDTEWIVKKGVLAEAFPVQEETTREHQVSVHDKPVDITKKFSADMPKQSPFENAGFMLYGNVTTAKVAPSYAGHKTTLGQLLLDEKDIPEEFFIKDDSLAMWEKLKGAKKEPRISKSGHEYFYSEGPMIFPDRLDGPSRTIVTGEGGSSPSRFKHVVKTKSGRYRRLLPIELEKLNMFPENHTQLDGISDTKRAFIMGNALVVGAIQKVGESLARRV